MKKKWKKLVSLLSVFAMVFATNITAFATTIDSSVHPLDSGKEILYYLFWTEDSKLKTDVDNLQKDLSFTDEQIEFLKQLGLEEHNACQELQETYSMDHPSEISLFQLALEENTTIRNQMIQEILGDKTEDFRNWINEWWENERQYRTGSSVTTISDYNHISQMWTAQYASNPLEVAKLVKWIYGMKMIMTGSLIHIDEKV